MNQPGYINVDQLQAETTLESAAARCGAKIDVRGGREVRIDCPFGCAGDHAGKKEISINAENPQKVFMCHAYQCQFRGNLLALMHGWLTGTRPTDGKLKGAEFNRVKRVLTGEVIQSRPTSAKSPASPPESPAAKPLRNIPLAEFENERARELVDIDTKFKVEPAEMNPRAAAYVQQHPCLTVNAMQKWRVGYLPHDGGGDKRGWSLRGDVVYPVLDEDGQVLSWVGRDPQFEQRDREFAALAAEERRDKSPPMKHRFAKGFHRGLELFGQQRGRLEEPGYRDVIARHGILVVEGFTDVIQLDSLGVPAVAVMSNKITEEQVLKIARWARRLAEGKVSLMFDCDAAGDSGAKEALWLLTQEKLNARLIWSTTMHGRAYEGEQPESVHAEMVPKLF